MSALSDIPYDIVVFAVLTVALVWRLRAVLGRRVNVEGTAPATRPLGVPNARAEDKPAPPEEPRAKCEIPQPGTRVGQILGQMKSVQPGFEAEAFLQNVQTAFRDVVTAFASGDRARLRQLLTPAAFDAFDAAITAREAARQQQRTEIVGVNSLSIMDAAIEPVSGGQKGRIDVQIVSRQISLLNDEGGQPLIGTEAVTEFHDLWQLECVSGPALAPPSWHLAAARAA